MNQQTFIQDTVSIANTVELVKSTINKVGLEFIAPLEQTIQDEAISKAINAVVTGDKA
jgi:osmotically-inducible protein OsmY